MLCSQRCAERLCFQVLLSRLLTSLSRLDQGYRIALARGFAGRFEISDAWLCRPFETVGS
jgi:hypothetical protein